MDVAFAERGAADDDLLGAPVRDSRGVRYRANSAAYADLRSVSVASLDAQLVDQFIVSGLAHGGGGVDDVQQGIFFEFVEQAENIRNCQFPPPAVHQLDRLSVLKIDARD